MPRIILPTTLLLLLLLPSSTPARPSSRTPAQAETLALQYLAHEVPLWSQQNHCFSCHNNGDAARALYAALRIGRAIPSKTLDNTTTWLSNPTRWDHNGGGDGPASDKRLARIQFSAALRESLISQQVTEQKPLLDAALQLAADQSPDGSWPVESGGVIGSPAGYGRPLASAMAVQVLRAARDPRLAPAIERAERWFDNRPIHNTLDAASALIALGNRAKPPLSQRCLHYFQTSQAPDGGWGPFATSAPEPFDTALAIVALARLSDPNAAPLIRQGRRFLASSQRPDGSWPETTRPPGGESYAQRLSTTGWAAWALLITSEPDQ